MKKETNERVIINANLPAHYASKREHFAAMAMQGIIANPGMIEDAKYSGAAKAAVKMADALLAELAKDSK